ncbi:MAG TPA: DUF2141 domain-containing protein [Candidatus Binataceae bacterium]
MKVSAAVFLALLAAGVAEAQTSNTPDTNAIKVAVVGLHSNDGEVYCALYTSADGFPDGFAKAAKTTTAKITNQQAVCEFPAITPGEYAISVYQDENSNGKLDRNFMGMPKEGVGASNDAKGSFGPPKFADARFSYKGGPQDLTIHLRYLLAPL